jgi:hypothetical protein
MKSARTAQDQAWREHPHAQSEFTIVAGKTLAMND